MEYRGRSVEFGRSGLKKRSISVVVLSAKEAKPDAQDTYDSHPNTSVGFCGKYLWLMICYVTLLSITAEHASFPSRHSS